MRAPKDHVSETRTAYAVVCYGDAWGREHACGTTYLTPKGVIAAAAHVGWKCPICGGNAYFDDENFDEVTNPEGYAEYKAQLTKDADDERRAMMLHENDEPCF